jgi:hypothetical protein
MGFCSSSYSARFTPDRRHAALARLAGALLRPWRCDVGVRPRAVEIALRCGKRHSISIAGQSRAGVTVRPGSKTTFVLQADVCETGAGDPLVMETTRIGSAAAAIAVEGLTRRCGVATAVDVPFAAPRRDRDRADDPSSDHGARARRAGVALRP